MSFSIGRTIVAFFTVLLANTVCLGQKKVTPVDDDPNRPPQPVLHYYDKHGNPLDEPVLFLAELDTVKSSGPKAVYPLLESMSFGVNFFDAAMLLAGQKHASVDVWAKLSLYNWLQPAVEMGVGFADNKPEDGNYRYKGKPSFYCKVGFDYNFLYKSNPAYQALFGARLGYSQFKYDITGITVQSSYWGETSETSILNQKSHSLYGEVLGGIQVRLGLNLSMGWSLRYRFGFKTSDGSNSTPWFVPGYGTGGKLGASFSLIYTLPFKHKDKTGTSVPETHESET